jgi:integrase
MRRNGAGIDQGICITSYVGQCRTVDQVVVCRMALPGKAGTQLIAAGLRERAPHHRSKGKGRSGQRASNSLSFHSLRHTAVSLLKDAGIPEGVVMELVGPDSKSMSAHYTHVGVEALEKAVAALPEI